MKFNSLIIRIYDSFGAFEKVSDGGLVGQDAAQYSEDIERCSSKLTVMLDDGHEAVCADCSYNFVLEIILRPNDKHRTDALHSIQSGKVIAAFVKEIERFRLIRYLIHCLHIVKSSFRNVNVCRNMSDYIKQCMHLQSALCLFEVSPLEQTHTKVYRRRIKRIELSIEFKRSCDSLALGKINHIVGKLLKDLAISGKRTRRERTKQYFPYFGYENSKPKTAPVVIGDDCWIGEKASLLKGSKLGNEVIVGYNCLLTGQEILDKSTVVSQSILSVKSRP